MALIGLDPLKFARGQKIGPKVKFLYRRNHIVSYLKLKVLMSAFRISWNFGDITSFDVTMTQNAFFDEKFYFFMFSPNVTIMIVSTY